MEVWPRAHGMANVEQFRDALRSFAGVRPWRNALSFVRNVIETILPSGMLGR
jgi:hypothetical protein